MKTLGIIAVIWILYCMYKVGFSPKLDYEEYHAGFAALGWLITIIIIISLIIIYLP